MLRRAITCLSRLKIGDQKKLIKQHYRDYDELVNELEKIVIINFDEVRLNNLFARNYSITRKG